MVAYLLLFLGRQSLSGQDNGDDLGTQWEQKDFTDHVVVGYSTWLCYDSWHWQSRTHEGVCVCVCYVIWNRKAVCVTRYIVLIFTHSPLSLLAILFMVGELGCFFLHAQQERYGNNQWLAWKSKRTGLCIHEDSSFQLIFSFHEHTVRGICHLQ